MYVPLRSVPMMFRRRMHITHNTCEDDTQKTLTKKGMIGSC